MTCTRNLPHCIRHEREIEPQNIPAFHVPGACKHHQPSMPTCVSMQTSSRARDVFCSGAVASWSSPVSLRFAHLQNRQAPQDACGVKSQLVAIVHFEASMPGPSRSERASQKRGYLFFFFFTQGLQFCRDTGGQSQRCLPRTRLPCSYICSWVMLEIWTQYGFHPRSILPCDRPNIWDYSQDHGSSQQRLCSGTGKGFCVHRYHAESTLIP